MPLDNQSEYYLNEQSNFYAPMIIDEYFKEESNSSDEQKKNLEIEIMTKQENEDKQVASSFQFLKDPLNVIGFKNASGYDFKYLCRIFYDEQLSYNRFTVNKVIQYEYKKNHNGNEPLH